MAATNTTGEREVIKKTEEEKRGGKGEVEGGGGEQGEEGSKDVVPMSGTTNGWPNLPSELLELILKLNDCSFVEYIICSHVCSPWRKAIFDCITSKRSPPRPFPLILLCNSITKNSNLILNLPQDKIYPMKTTWPDQQCIGSVEGWLILYRSHCVKKNNGHKYGVCENYISFLNPISGDTIYLPPESASLSAQDDQVITSAHVVAESVRDSKQRLVAAYFLNGNRKWLAFCRVKDKSWTRIAEVEVPHNLAINKNKLYAVDLMRVMDHVMVFDLEDPNDIKKNMLHMQDADADYDRPILRLGIQQRDGANLFFIDKEKVFLALDSSSGDLFLVAQMNDVHFVVETNSIGIDYDILPVKSYRVFRLDFSGPRWEEVENLGDRSIFLSYAGSRVISADMVKNGSETSEDFKIGNSIFFAIQSKKTTMGSLRCDIGVFSMIDRSIKHFPRIYTLEVQTSDSLFWLSPSPE